MQNPRPSRRLALGALALTFLLASCSQGGTTSSQTTQAHGKGSSSTASAASSGSKDAHIAFGQCMRAQGYDVPDTGLTPDQITDTSDAFNGAINKCMQEVSPLVGEEDDFTNDAATRQSLVKGAQCLRDLGYDVKDPKPGEGVSIQNIPTDAVNKCFGNPRGGK